jgi:DNA repair ATPase RecN
MTPQQVLLDYLQYRKPVIEKAILALQDVLEIAELASKLNKVAPLNEQLSDEYQVITESTKEADHLEKRLSQIVELLKDDWI